MLLHSPPNKYLIAAPLVLYRGMFEVFGLGADVPYRVVTTALVLLCAGLFFVIARRRVGDLLALAPTVLLLFFGAGWETVITPLRIPSLIAVASGLGTLVALERPSRRGNVAAAGLLTVSVASHPVGLAFLAAAAVRVVLRPSPERWRGIWVPAIPAAAFGAWWLFLRAPTTDVIAPTRAIDVVRFVRDSWTAIVAQVTGLAGVIGQPSFDQTVAQVAAAALLAVIVVVVALRWRRVPPSFWAAAAALVVLMAATRLSPGGFLRSPEEVRYLYPEGVLFLLLAVELAGVVGARGWVALAAAVVLALGLAYNLDQLGDGGTEARATSLDALGEYSAYELAGPRLDEAYKPGEFAPSAGDYVDAAAAYGSAADSPAELAQAPLEARQSADAALAGSLGIALRAARSGGGAGTRAPVVDRVLSGQAIDRDGCVRLQPGPPTAPAPRIPLNPQTAAARALQAAITGRPAKPSPLVPELAELSAVDRGLRVSAPNLRKTVILLGRFAQPPSARLDRAPRGRSAALRIQPPGPGPRGAPPLPRAGRSPSAAFDRGHLAP